MVTLTKKTHQKIPVSLISLLPYFCSYLSYLSKDALMWPSEIGFMGSNVLNLICNKTDFTLVPWEKLMAIFAQSFLAFSLTEIQKQSVFLILGAPKFLGSLFPAISAVHSVSCCLCTFLAYKFSRKAASNTVILVFCFPSHLRYSCTLGRHHCVFEAISGILKNWDIIYTQ